MNKQQLDKLLFTNTENEDYYLSHPGTISKKYDAVPRKMIQGKEVFLLHSYTLDKNEIGVRKDSRYTFMPFYTFDCINLNYIYSGQCTYFINGKEIILHKGDLCLFDKGTVRTKMKTRYEDIIINLVVSDTFFKNSILVMQKENILAQFVAHILEANSNHDNYIIFRDFDTKKIQNFFVDLLIEAYDTKDYKVQVMQSYLSLIFVELLRLYQKYPNKQIVQFSDSQSNHILQMISYIELHYQDCTLQDLSNVFGYHQKYICAL